MNENKFGIHKNIFDYGANIDEAIMDSLNKNYGFNQSKCKDITRLHFELQNNNVQHNEAKVHVNVKYENADNDVIGMMWEPELDFVDDQECYNENIIKNGPMRYMCGVCLGQYRTRCALDIHFKIHRGEILFKCVLCDTIFSELATLKQHRELHNINELVKCGICGLVFTEMYQMMKHKKKYHFKETEQINNL